MPRSKSADIDTLEDFDYAQWLLERQAPRADLRPRADAAGGAGRRQGRGPRRRHRPARASAPPPITSPRSVTRWGEGRQDSVMPPLLILLVGMGTVIAAIGLGVGIVEMEGEDLQQYLDYSGVYRLEPDGEVSRR